MIQDILFDVAPEFTTTDAGELARIARMIGYAQQSVNPVSYGTRSDLATALMTAHMMTLAKRAGQGGSVTSEKVGELSRSYSTGEFKSAAWLSSTAYGQQLLGLQNQTRKTPLLV